MGIWTTTPKTWAVGDKHTAVVDNAQLRDLANAFGAWTSYTPALGGSGWAIGNGTVTAAYLQVQKTVMFRARFVFGSTSTFGGAASPTVTLPVAAAAGYPTGTTEGLNAYVYVVDTGAATRPGFALLTSSTVLTLYTMTGTTTAAALITSTAPHTWAATDVISIHGTYEAA